jgi:hypothetical protein
MRLQGSILTVSVCVFGCQPPDQPPAVAMPRAAEPPAPAATASPPPSPPALAGPSSAPPKPGPASGPDRPSPPRVAQKPAPKAEPAAPPPGFAAGILDDVEFRVRSALPGTVAVDGVIDEWLDRTPATHRSTIVVTLQPSRFFVAFDVDLAHRPPGFELELPGGDLPDIGAIVRGGGTYEVNCEHLPWNADEKLTPAARQSCLAISRRFAALKLKQAQRFRTTFALDEAETSVPAPTARQCRRNAERLACEAEYPLARLPRTRAVDVAELGLRLHPGAAGAALEPLWLTLPEPVAFEPGLALRRLLLPELPPMLPEADRYSYQPGEPLEYEIAERDARGGYGMSDIAVVRCRPSAVVASFGRVTIRRSCGSRGEGIVYVDDAPRTTISLGAPTKFIPRGGKLHVITESRWFEESSASDELAIGVQSITSDGQVLEAQRISVSSSTCRSFKATHDTDYKVLKLICRTRPEVENTRATTLTRTLTWSDEQTGFVESD